MLKCADGVPEGMPGRNCALCLLLGQSSKIRAEVWKRFFCSKLAKQDEERNRSIVFRKPGFKASQHFGQGT